jgi:hypothetical protein
MRLVSALVGLVALGDVALSVAPASAMPAGMSAQASQSPYVVQAAYVCNEWGRCWHQHYYGGGYYHPHYWYWHHWHPHYNGGWGYGGWHHWHHWSQW